jgi:SAM-dependent methyltransferase
MRYPDPSFLPSPEAPSFGPIDVHGLEIGGGDHPRRLKFRQFDAIDWAANDEELRKHGVVFDIGDARALPYGSGRFEHVFSSNLLEHFPSGETTAVLTEWTRVLEPGGCLELLVPDSMGILADYFEKRNTWPHCQERLLGSRDYDGNEHFVAFTVSSFHYVLERVPELHVAWCVSCAAGGGVHALAYKTRGSNVQHVA